MKEIFLPIVLEAEAVIEETWNNVEMRMKDFLAGNLTVSQEEIDPIAAYSTTADCFCDHPADLGHMSE
jgi:hypothetical protein